MTSNFFFFNDTAPTEIYTLSLHDALPIFLLHQALRRPVTKPYRLAGSDVVVHVRHTTPDLNTLEQVLGADHYVLPPTRSEEHTSELQSRQYLVCRLLLEKKKNKPVADWHR